MPHASTDSVRGLPLTLTHTLLCVQMQGALGCMSSNIDIVPSAQLCMPNFDFAQLRRAIEQAGVAQPDDAPNDLLNYCLDSSCGGLKFYKPPPGPRAKQEAAATRMQVLYRLAQAEFKQKRSGASPATWQIEEARACAPEARDVVPPAPAPSPPPPGSQPGPGDSTAEVRVRRRRTLTMALTFTLTLTLAPDPQPGDQRPSRPARPARLAAALAAALGASRLDRRGARAVDGLTLPPNPNPNPNP